MGQMSKRRLQWVAVIVGMTCFGVILHAAPSTTQMGNILLSADQFELDGQNQQILASGNVVIKQRSITIKGQNARYDRQKGMIWVTDQVQASNGEYTLTADQLVANDIANTIDAAGNVRFKYDTMYGSSRSASFDLTKQTIVLSGDPMAHRDSDTISAKTITIFLAQKRIISSGDTHIRVMADRFKGM